MDASAPRKPTRRTVVKALALTPLAPSLMADTVMSAPEATPPQAQQPASPQPSPIADAMTDVIRRRYGAHLTQEQLEEVRKDIQSRLDAADKLRAVPLKNSDEPDVVFKAVTSDE